MEPDVSSGGSVREVRLEGLALAAVVGLVLALAAGAFLLGRWVERQSVPAVTAAGVEAAPAIAPDALAPAPSHFDAPRGPEQALEPTREVRRPERAAATPSRPGAPDPAPAAPAAAAAGDPFWVQVSAGRDRAAAEALVQQLVAAGFPARLFSEAEGQGELVKVRVGSYPSEEAARQAAESLKQQGHPGAWVSPAR